MKKLLMKYLSLPGYLSGIITAIGLIALMIYSGIKGEQLYQDRQKRIANAAQIEDPTICLSFIKIKDINGLNVTAIDRRLNMFHLFSDTVLELEKGGTYSFAGQITPSGKIKITSFQAHRHRKLKYLISSLSFIVVIFLIKKYFRIDKKGIYLINIDKRRARTA